MPLQDTDRPIGIVVAVQEELRAILKRMSPAVVDSVGGFRFYSGKIGGKRVVVVKSGMGAARAELATATHIQTYMPCALIIAGFCGGLIAEPGELFIPARVLDDTRNGIGGEAEPDQALLSKARAISGTKACHYRQKLLTTPKILRTKAEKQLACRDARTFHAVDMETFGAAEAAIRATVPWIAIRAVTDGQMDNLPLDFSRFMDENGEVNRGNVVAAVLFRPWKIPAMIRLSARSSLAARNLAAFVERYVTEL
jgi:adenosylhomocysteine nucleosidase